MHRDLKPENLMIGKDGENIIIKLVDFGLSVFIDVYPRMFPRCGTPGYIAPEVMNVKTSKSGKYDEKCDIFSLGIIYHIICTGDSVFEVNSYQELLK